MRRYIFLIITMLLILPINVFAEEKGNDKLISNATSGLLMEASTLQQAKLKPQDRMETEQERQ